MRAKPESWRDDDVDLGRVSARPQCIVAAWILAAIVIALSAVGPAAAALIETTIAKL
jgi:hypothetical protein